MCVCVCVCVCARGRARVYVCVRVRVSVYVTNRARVLACVLARSRAKRVGTCPSIDSQFPSAQHFFPVGQMADRSSSTQLSAMGTQLAPGLVPHTATTSIINLKPSLHHRLPRLWHPPATAYLIVCQRICIGLLMTHSH